MNDTHLSTFNEIEAFLAGTQTICLVATDASPVVTPDERRIAPFFVRAEARFFRVVISLGPPLAADSAPDALVQISQALDHFLQKQRLSTGLLS